MTCELTGRGAATIQTSFHSRRLDMRVHVRVSPDTFRDVHRHGGIDSFLIQMRKEKLSKKAKRLRRELTPY